MQELVEKTPFLIRALYESFQFYLYVSTYVTATKPWKSETNVKYEFYAVTFCALVSSFANGLQTEMSPHNSNTKQIDRLRTRSF